MYGPASPSPWILCADRAKWFRQARRKRVQSLYHLNPEQLRLPPSDQRAIVSRRIETYLARIGLL